ncbi:hypothetical protein WT98_03185 [Burkholderia territorii]|nr:hypothetical protein WT98_03185 [Burkholderia territorii]
MDALSGMSSSVDGQFKPLIAGFGFWPRALQKANVEKAKERGQKPPIMRSTMNVRDDNLGKSPLYGPTWRSGGRCLIPARYVIEPSYPDARQDSGGGGYSAHALGKRSAASSAKQCALLASGAL